jgi:hypothetical protein
MLDDVLSIVTLTILVSFPGIPSSSIASYRCILVDEEEVRFNLPFLHLF